MNPSNRVELRRYWRPRSFFGHSENDVEAARAVGQEAVAGLSPIAEATNGSCTVLLAPPGAGKTTDLHRLIDSGGRRARRVHLPSLVGDSRIFDLIAGIIAEITAPDSVENGPASYAPEPLLALDSVDEAPLDGPNLIELVREVAKAARRANVRLVLACRSASWLTGVEEALWRTFDTVNVFLIEPLDRENIAEYLRSADVDVEVFLDAVRDAGIIDLVTSPHTLRLLVDDYLEGGGALPSEQIELFRRASRRLLADPAWQYSPSLRAAAEPLLEAARWLAALSILGGRPLLTLTDVPGPHRLTDADCAAVINSTDYDAALRTALFASSDGRHHFFAYQTVTEFLAAEHLVNSGLPADQLTRLLAGPGKRPAPQLQAVAAWMISMAPERFQALLGSDPEAFLGSNIELRDARYRSVLVDRLLEMAQRYETGRIEHLRLTRLHYDGIEQRLRAVLDDRASTSDACYLAVRIARLNSLNEMHDALLKTALDTTRSVAVRSAAGRAALELGPPTPDSRLATLADPALQQSGDEDELFGIGLRALLRSGTSPAAVLPRLKSAENPDLYGNYRSFLTGTLPSAFQSTQMSPAEVQESLRWVTETERQAPIRGPQLGGLAEQTAMVCDAILLVGLQMLADPTVRSGVADVIAGRAARHLSLLRERRTELPQMEPVARRDLLVELQARSSSALLALRLRQAGLLGADDFVSLLGRAEALATNVKEAQQWRPWLVNAYDATRPEHLAALGQVASNSPLFQEVARHWLNPPDPSSHDAPPFHEDESDESEPVLTTKELRAKLRDSLTQPPAEAFHTFCYWAQIRPDQQYVTESFEVNVENLPGWQTLDAVEQDTATDCAIVYLKTARSNGADLLGTGSFNTGALAAARALVLMSHRRASAALEPSRWKFWAPALIRGPFVTADDLPMLPALKGAYRYAREELLSAAERDMRGRPDSGQFTLRRIAPVLTAEAAAWLETLVSDTTLDAATTGGAFQRLVEVDAPRGIALLRRYIDKGDRGSVRRLAAKALEATPGSAWPVLQPLLSADGQLATDVIEDVAYGQVFDVRQLAEHHLVELWELTNTRFPPEQDPTVHGMHIVTPRESAADLRNRLLPALADRGTDAAVTQLQQLVARKPKDVGLKRLLTFARREQSRTQWQPLQPDEIIELLTANPSRRRAIALQRGSLAFLLGAAVAVPIDTAFWSRDGLETGTWIFSFLFLLVGIVQLVVGRLHPSTGDAPEPSVWRKIVGLPLTRIDVGVVVVALAICVAFAAFAERGDEEPAKKAPPQPAPSSTTPNQQPSAAVKASASATPARQTSPRPANSSSSARSARP
ncbi:NACHT domain-containing protein [Actinoplanes sp. NPDC051859]|uniref:NACHT domain-containing protein n=1 Tax=Actinoplanes sp. NPDC051859 TaxID=3363909 RepID=UPI0037975AF8